MFAENLVENALGDQLRQVIIVEPVTADSPHIVVGSVHLSPRLAGLLRRQIRPAIQEADNLVKHVRTDTLDISVLVWLGLLLKLAQRE